MTWSRRLRTALTVLAVSFIVTAQLALAADPNTGPTNPTGFADLLPTPDITHGDTRTLFEQYSPNAYGLTFDTGLTDSFNVIFNGYAYIVLMYVMAITRAAISVGWWLFSFTDVKSLTDATSATIGATGTQLVGWLLPSALAFGAIAAYSQRRTSGTALGQLAWVFVAGLISISFAVAPATWMRGVDGARQLGSGAVMAASSDALGSTIQSPMTWPEPGFPGAPKETLLRKSGDASWRAFAVTPWCIAEFGSVTACQRYGKGMLDTRASGGDTDAYIDKVITPAEGGGDSPTVKWVKGHSPFERVAVLMLAAIATTLFSFLNIALAFTALMAFIGALLLLVVGVFFACLWIIPGRPRQWGLNWFEALIGLVLQSFLAMLVFGTALTLVTAVFTLTESMGWLPVTGLAITVLVVGLRLRRLLDNLTTMMRPGSGSIMLGGMARRGAVGAMRRLSGALSGRGASPTPTPADRKERTASTDASPQRVSSVRVYRQAPMIGSLSQGASGGAARELTAGPDRSRTEAASRLAGSGTPGAAAQAASVGAGTVGTRGASNLARSRSQSKTDDSRRVISVSAASVAPSPGGGRSSTEAKKARHSRAQKVSQSEIRYEPRSYTPSASLREGPPKAARLRRKPTSQQQRRFREYSAITKDGVTVHVPTRR
jgi:hypothetical protein